MSTFGEATAVSARGAGRYTAELDPLWAVGVRPQGGYMMAIMGRAALDAAANDRHPHVTSVGATFIEPPVPGPAEVTVELLRSGRTLTQARARLSQDGRPMVDAVLTLGLLDDSGPEWSAVQPPSIPPEDECVLVPNDPPVTGFTIPLMDVVEVRIAPGDLAFMFGAPRREGVTHSWQRLKDGSDWDPLSLLVALDPVPPASYDLGVPGWAPTVQLTAYIHRLPTSGPIRVRLSATDLGGDRMHETAQAWDAKDRPVAQATQLAAIRVPG
ncbi:thioesterase family protein [Spongiactinospora sp. 9N601]|uniref:thioesterase family protein n=1 Tax=Spongiactinospora sp. 9N601 TaxID=3375149 RepID=UPI0037B827EF